MYLGAEGQGKLHRRANEYMLGLEGFSQMVRGGQAAGAKALQEEIAGRVRDQCH